jgi:hypothetical protein
VGHVSFQFDRRAFLRSGLIATGAALLGPRYLARALAQGPVSVGDGPYGPLGPFDANGIALPAGFRSREIARGSVAVPGSSPAYPWHFATDGQATFPTLDPLGRPDGGWILVANSEVPIPGAGGASAVEFAPGGSVERAYRILAGTTSNCAGGPAPWGRWLSCEEHDEGQVWECDPAGAEPAIPRPALGVFTHEAACVDPARGRVYLTEDQTDGCLYRFTPSAYPDLSSGLLEVAVVDGAGRVGWTEVPDPAGGAANPTRRQVPAAAHFNGGEGTWHDEGIVYFTTKGDNRVWAHDIAARRLDVIYDAAAVGPGAPLSGVDNITVAPSGDIYVCEDGRDHDICLITPAFEVARFLKLDPAVHAGPAPPSPVAGNETVGVVFSPRGDRLYFGAQRSFPTGPVQIPMGVVYEIRGPFRKVPGRDRRPPRLGLRAPRRMAKRRFLRHGAPVRLDLSEPAGVRAILQVHVPGPGGGRRRVIAAARPRVALNGKVTLRLRPSRRGAALLRRRRDVTLHLKVVGVDGAGNRVATRRRIRLIAAKPAGG